LYAFDEKGRCQAFQLALRIVFFLLAIPHTLAGQKFLEVEKQVTVTWRKVGTAWMVLRNLQLELFRVMRVY
jgi:hypothetical protein